MNVLHTLSIPEIPVVPEIPGIETILDLATVFSPTPVEVVIYQSLRDRYVIPEKHHTTWIYTHSTEVGKYSGYHPSMPAVGNKKLNWQNGRKHYYDSFYYLGLVAGVANTPVACLGFNQDKEYSLGLVVSQIQGLPHTRELLDGIRWEKLLLHTLCEWAFKHSPIVRIRVVAAESGGYYPKIPPTPPQSQYQSAQVNYEQSIAKQNRLKMFYDVTPKRLGFKRSEHPSELPLKTNLKPYFYSSMTRFRYLTRFG